MAGQISPFMGRQCIFMLSLRGNNIVAIHHCNKLLPMDQDFLVWHHEIITFSLETMIFTKMHT